LPQSHIIEFVDRRGVEFGLEFGTGRDATEMIAGFTCLEQLDKARHILVTMVGSSDDGRHRLLRERESYDAARYTDRIAQLLTNFRGELSMSDENVLN
jgi:hypothetical protein